MAQEYGPKVVTDGLILCLDAADKNSYPGSGTTWSDLSGNGFNATLSAAAIGTDIPGSMDFNGSDEYATLNGLATSIVDEMAWSVSIWFKGDGTTEGYINASCMFSAHDSGGGNIIRLGLDRVVDSEGIFYSDPGSSDIQLGSTNWNDQLYHHLVITRPAGDGGQTVTAYVDGVSVGTNGSADFSGNVTAQVSIAMEYDGGSKSDYHGGEVNIVMFYNKALSAKEVSQNFNAHRSRFSV